MIRALAIVLAILLGVIVWQRGSVWKSDAAAAAAIASRYDANTKLSAAKAEIDELGSTIATERGNVRAANALAARYEQEKKHAQDESDRLVDDLRAGQRQLHQRWQAALHTAAMSQAASAASQPDGGADDRFQSAGRIIGAADQCDAQVRALQAYAIQCGGEP